MDIRLLISLAARSVGAEGSVSTCGQRTDQTGQMAQVTVRGAQVILLIFQCDGSYMQLPLGPVTVEPQ